MFLKQCKIPVFAGKKTETKTECGFLNNATKLKMFTPSVSEVKGEILKKNRRKYVINFKPYKYAVRRQVLKDYIP